MINTGKLAGRTLFITGACRGVGKAIALKAARDGANIVVAARTTEPNAQLPGTIYTAAEEIQKAGGRAFPCAVDVCDEEQVQLAIQETVSRFGGIDIVINNASVTSLANTAATHMKHFDLMHQTNTRAAFLVSQECLPCLIKSEHAHILNISPPLNLDPKWIAPHIGYTISKYGMSLCVLGMAHELSGVPIAVNALWPRTSICTEITKAAMGPESIKRTRKVDIMADAAYAVLIREPTECTGRFLIDDEVLTEAGVTDLKQYASAPEYANELFYDNFLDIPKEKLKPVERDIPAWKSMPKNVATAKKRQIPGLFKQIESVLSAEIVGKIRAVFQFNIEGYE